jgi:hypothetical protein
MSFLFRMRATPSPSSTYHPMMPDTPEIYQVNNQGMGIICRALSASKVLDADCECPSFDATLPEWLKPRRVDEIMDALECGDEPDPPMTDEEKQAIDEAQLAQERLLETTSPKPGMVPAFKFGSNDGWVVTANECKSIGLAMERLLADDQLLNSVCPAGDSRSLLVDWRNYVHVAEETGGFTVQ